jgi:hypothetical protein
MTSPRRAAGWGCVTASWLQRSEIIGCNVPLQTSDAAGVGRALSRWGEGA